MMQLLASLPPKRKMHTSALYPGGPPTTCPAAALMARRSQIELAIPVAVSAAHAPFHRKSRRDGSISCDLLRRLMVAPSKRRSLKCVDTAYRIGAFLRHAHRWIAPPGEVEIRWTAAFTWFR